MRKLFTLSLVLFFSISTTSIFAQAHLSGYDPLQMLIKFEPGTSEDSIDYYMAGIER